MGDAVAGDQVVTESPRRLAAAAAAPDDMIVVIGMDGSDHSLYAFHWYVQKIHQPYHKVVIVHCSENRSKMKIPNTTITDASLDEIYAEDDIEEDMIDHRTRESTEDRIRRHVQEAKIQACLVKPIGDPGQKLIQVANDKKASMIVTGSRGLGRIKRALIGSVSDYTLRNAPCPVLVCRMDKS